MDAPQKFHLTQTHTHTQMHRRKVEENVAKIKVTSSYKRVVWSGKLCHFYFGNFFLVLLVEKNQINIDSEP